MDAPKMEVSSTTIKAHREQPQKLLKWLSEAVIKIIDEKNLSVVFECFPTLARGQNFVNQTLGNCLSTPLCQLGDGVF